MSYEGSKRSREFEMNVHYATLMMLRNKDPIQAVVETCGFIDGAVAYAKRFWTGVFQDFPELRQPFRDMAERFGPYTEPLPPSEDPKSPKSDYGLREQIERMMDRRREFDSHAQTTTTSTPAPAPTQGEV